MALIGHLLGYQLSDAANFVPLTLVGRVISALFDSGTVLLTGCLGLVLARKTPPLRAYAWNMALLAAAFMTFSPLDLQLSHFYTVDTLLNFFVLLTILACVFLVDAERIAGWSALAGIAYGLALATKFSAAPLALVLVVATGLRWYRRRDFLSSIVALLWAAVLVIFIFFVTQPYAWLDMSNYIQQVSDQSNLVRGSLDLPYVRQFFGTIPVLYQGQNLVLWGLGVTLGTTSLLGLIWLIWLLWHDIFSPWLLIFSWVVVYGAIVCTFFVKYMRYMLPLYPFLALMAAALLIVVAQRLRWLDEHYLERFHWMTPFLQAGLIILVLGGTIFQGLALLNVYSEPNTRILASEWIYQHIPAGSVLTYEQWDDSLPVAIAGHTPGMYVQESYVEGGQTVTGLDLYSDDTQVKAQLLASILPKVNVITMPTDRLDKSIPKDTQRYPLTTHYYQLLFSGQLGFHLAATFENHPHLFGITLDDSNADESYSVFDHPTARIFVRDTPYPYTSQQLSAKLLSGVRLPSS